MSSAIQPSTWERSRGGPAAPGPRGHWLLGCMRELRGDSIAFYERTWRQYGDYARIRVVPGMYLHLLAHPDAVEHVLVRHHKNYRKPDFLNGPLGELAGRGLVTSDGETWRTQRQLAQPAFHRERLAGLGGIMSEATGAMLREWERYEPGRRLDMLPAMLRLSLRNAGQTLFGADISGEADAFGEAFRTAIAHVRRMMDAPPWLPRRLPTPAYRRFAAARTLLDRVVQETIDARRGGRGSDTGRSDLLTLLLAARDETTGQGMSDQQLRDEVMTLLVAGHDTVGSALAWAWYLLGQHPEIQEELADEAGAVLGGRTPAVADLPRLPLARAVFEESLRLYPPAPGLPRQAIAEDEIGGHVIPSKGLVVVCQTLTHRHPAFWREPDRFDPSRFLPGGSVGLPKFAYFPFGGGPRACIGSQFALMEGTLVLAAIAARFRVELVPGQAIEPDTTFTLKPKPGVEVVLWPR